MEVHPDWAPLGAARFEELIDDNFFKGARFFRVIDGKLLYRARDRSELGVCVKASWRSLASTPIQRYRIAKCAFVPVAGPVALHCIISSPR